MKNSIDKDVREIGHVVTVRERPDLVPVVARWLWDEWRRDDGYSLEEAIARVAKRTSPSGPEQCFVLLVNSAAVATASLTHCDLPARPDLKPWLAEVFVKPRFRHRGFASRLVRCVETACRSAQISNIWLFTDSAADLYSRLGWRAVGIEAYHGTDVTLMHRNLGRS
jgi:N-acetylglutamate synthase-like GNAT family acetyltransferase